VAKTLTHKILAQLRAEVAALGRDNAALKQQLSDQGWLTDAINATNNTVIVTDPTQPDNPIIYANKGFEQLTGYSVGETLGQNCRFLQGSDTDQAELERLREAVRDGKNIRVVLRNYRKDGSMFWNELYITAIYEGGVLANFIGVQNDISKFVEADQERALLGAAVEQADESILITEAELEQPGPRITYVNAAFERLSGYSRDEVIGRTPRLMQGPKTDPQVLGRLRHTLAAGEIFRGETVNYRKDGEAFFNEWHIAPIQRGGETTHWVATQRDVTERRELERLVLEASALEQQRVAQDLHDTLGQHLTGTAFLASSLARRVRAVGDPQLTADAEQITALVNEGIAQTRALARGLYPVELQEQGLTRALERLCDTTRTVFGMACSLRVSGEPTATPEEALQLYRIVQEALNNAFKHGRAAQVEVHWQRLSDGRSLSVIDDGVGIAQTSQGEGRAQGLGLRIMHYRAQLVGATLSVTPAGDAGTVVRCRLPQDTAVPAD
jgi:PAS domain S-box-containing protein